MLPVEGVIFSFIRDSPFLLPLRAVAAHEGPNPFPPQFDVMPGCLPTPLLERVKHVDALGEFGYIQDAILKSRMNTNLAYSGSDSWNRLPIQRLQPLLNLPEMKTRQAPGITRERPDVTSRGSEPQKRPIRHPLVCKYWYVLSTAGGKSPNYRINPPSRRITPLACARAAPRRPAGYAAR